MEIIKTNALKLKYFELFELAPCTNMPLNEAVVTNIPPNNLQPVRPIRQSRTEERTEDQAKGRKREKLDPPNCMKV